MVLNYVVSRGVGGTVASESALRPAATLLSRVRAPPPAPWPDGESESLRSPYCGLAIHKNLVNLSTPYIFLISRLERILMKHLSMANYMNISTIKRQLQY
ncbi:hypothetical protein PoB_004322100 [Plakobranchus ocellatus]|uniref:Uncharacterized protein n=1 Tax=Plakobranchus ocellatus TaxID=259542 RepID=A0AAV4B8F3_9GAST|nr:hypothetical protein PoB_004322100 [Plakobranchus ocellatus]